MSPVTTINRQSKGRPDGGEFAAHDRPEADISLVDLIAKNAAIADPLKRGLTDVQILEESRILARVTSSKAGLNRWDTEDVAQETVLSVLFTQSNNPEETIKGGLLRHAARALVSRRMDTHQNHTDSTAFRQWKLDVEQMEAEFGRHMTTAELDTHADEIRARWHDPRHRPSRNFQYETKVVSSDAMGAAFADTFSAGADHPGADKLSAEAEVKVNRAHSIADDIEAGRIDKTTARRMFWNIMAGEHDVPESIRGSVTESRARNYKDIIPDGFVAANAFLEGTITTAEQEAFFAPFAKGAVPLSNRDMYSIASVISSRPQIGARLWRSALDYSNARNSK